MAIESRTPTLPKNLPTVDVKVKLKGPLPMHFLYRTGHLSFTQPFGKDAGPISKTSTVANNGSGW